MATLQAAIVRLEPGILDLGAPFDAAKVERLEAAQIRGGKVTTQDIYFTTTVNKSTP
jgi:hypothetical protein